MALLAACSALAQTADRDWPVYGGNAMGQRHSPLTQINRSNVGQLEQAWRFDAGSEGGIQTSPIVIGRKLFAYTPDQHAIALDGATGKLLWKFDPGDTSGQPARGLAYWTEGSGRRLFASSVTNLYALDPDTGRPIASFGDGGKIDLRQDLGRDPEQNAVFLTSPGIIHRDLIIVGFRTSENPPAPPGDIRAYDARTGKLRWSFHTIPHPGEAGHETWPQDAWKTAGGANAWAGMALDAERSILYVPTGSAVFDFYGADRIGDNLYANSLLALDANTGKRLWHFQAVHHDLWDRDFPSPPTLLTVTHEGRRVDAVAQASKQGFLFVFDRVTGKPLFPIEERPVPQSPVEGEKTAPTQPFPLKPAPYARQRLTEAMLTTRTPQAHAEALAKFRGMRNDGPFTPFVPDQDTIVFPGFDGGTEWGGSAADPKTGVLYLNASDVPSYSRLVSTQAFAGASDGEQVYQANCAACHGPDLAGSPPAMPSLIGLRSRRFQPEIWSIITKGRGRMPGFPQLSQAEVRSVTSFLMNHGGSGSAPAAGASAAPAARQEVVSSGAAAARMPYIVGGYNRFQDAQGYPAVQPPWGTLNAIDLNTGEYLWTVPLGEYPELAAQGMANTGSENYGGPVVTDGGLVFIGATMFDRKFRAFDSRTGKLLWQTLLPFAGVATPITYSIDGRQYVLIGTSGSRDPKGPQGAAYVAFALPGNVGTK
ncbi:MAG: PQQ-binding-like beta-propeller repeat protein [Novosphingobium sp.]